MPSFILQALAENSVKHGLSSSEDGGVIRISTRTREAFLVVEVSDSGDGDAAQSEEPSYGIGLNNLRARLHRLYGPEVGLEVTRRTDGTTTIVTIPTGRDSIGVG